MGCDFTNRLVYGTYFMLWTVLLNTVFSDMTTVACPAPCTCKPSSQCTGTYVYCYNEGLKEVPTGIPKDTCQMNLGWNWITTIDNNAFAGLSQLNKLWLGNNQITAINNNAFAGLSQLTKLSLPSNLITRIDSNTFAGLSRLNILRLHNNKITTIDNNAFMGLSQLTELRLHSNKITTIDNNAFAGLSQLTELSLYSNQITTIDNNAFAGLSQLNTLSLQYNQITTFDKNAFAGLSQLNILYVFRNPLKCDCDLRQFVMFMQRKRILPHNETYIDEPKCSSPDHFRGMEIINVPYHNMSCDSTSDQTTITMTDTSSMHTSPPSISASVTTDNKRTSAGVLIDTHIHRTLSTVTHTQVQSSSGATRSHTQTSTPVAHTHDHTSTGSTLTHPRTSTPVISTQDLTSITPTSTSTVNISTVITSTPVSIPYPAERTNTTDKQIQDAYGLAVSAVVMVLLLLLGWILRSILGHFGIECRVPVRRGRGRRSDVENPQPRDEETRPKERLEMMESTAAGKRIKTDRCQLGQRVADPARCPPKSLCC